MEKTTADKIEKFVLENEYAEGEEKRSVVSTYDLLNYLNFLVSESCKCAGTGHDQEGIRPPSIDLSDFTDSEKFAFFKSNIARLIPEQQEKLGCHLLFANSQAQIAKRLYNEWLEEDENWTKEEWLDIMCATPIRDEPVEVYESHQPWKTPDLVVSEPAQEQEDEDICTGKPSCMSDDCVPF